MRGRGGFELSDPSVSQACGQLRVFSKPHRTERGKGELYRMCKINGCRDIIIEPELFCYYF